MGEITFIGRVYSVGSSFVVTIPKDFVNHGPLRNGSRYRITIATKGETLVPNSTGGGGK